MRFHNTILELTVPLATSGSKIELHNFLKETLPEVKGTGNSLWGRYQYSMFCINNFS